MSLIERIKQNSNIYSVLDKKWLNSAAEKSALALPCNDNQPFNFDPIPPSENHNYDPPSTSYNAQSP